MFSLPLLELKPELRTLALVSSCGIYLFAPEILVATFVMVTEKISDREATVTVRPNSRLNRDAEKGL